MTDATSVHADIAALVKKNEQVNEDLQAKVRRRVLSNGKTELR